MTDAQFSEKIMFEKLIETTRVFYSDPENIKRFKEWQKKRKAQEDAQA